MVTDLLETPLLQIEFQTHLVLMTDHSALLTFSVGGSIFDLLLNVIASFCLLPPSRSLLYFFFSLLTITPTEILNCHSYSQIHHLLSVIKT